MIELYTYFSFTNCLAVSPYASASKRKQHRTLFTTHFLFSSDMRSLVAILAVVMMAQQSEAFAGGAIMGRSVTSAATGPRRAGNGLKMVDVVVEFTNSKKTVNAVVGTPLSQLCAKNKIKVKYNCKQGDCATCSINIDGRNVKACQGRVPASRRIIKIKA